MKKLLISLAMMALVASMVLAVTQTGNIVVTVTSEEGQALPGATVKISSDVLMGTRTQQTGSNGKTIFRNLAPGTYTVDVLMDSFQPGQGLIRVYIQKNAKVYIPLKLGEATEVITVVQTAPIVDTSSSAVSQDFDFEHSINHIPSGRHYNDLLNMAAGSMDGNNPNMMGASDDDNLYLVDGISTVDSRTQTWSDQFNIDIIADVSTQSAGISAEYSGMQGAVLNMITKSGSNNFQGILRLELERVDWNDDSEITGSKSGANNDDLYVSGGGPLWPDAIWWYVGYNFFPSDRTWSKRIDPRDLSLREDMVRPYHGHTLTLKGTVQVGEDLKVNVLYMESPVTIRNLGYYFGQMVQAEAEWARIQGSDTSLVANLSYILTEDMFIEGRWAHAAKVLTNHPQVVDGDYVFEPSSVTGPVMYAWDSSFIWGTCWSIYNSDRNNDLYGAAFNWLLETDSLGYHDIKVGIDYTDLWSVTYAPSDADGSDIVTAILGHWFDDYLSAPGWKLKYTYDNMLPAAETHALYYSVYIQDSIELTEDLTLNLGLRFDPASVTNNQDETVTDSGIFDTLAPRLGFTYIVGDGFSVRGSFSRMYDLYDLSVADDFNVFPIAETANVYAWTGAAWANLATWTTGDPISLHSIDDDFGMAYTDEVTFGVDYQLSASFAVSGSVVYRIFNNVAIRQDLDGNGYVNWENLNTTEYGGKWKDYMGVMFRIVKRPTSDNLYLQATLTYQTLNGFKAGDGGTNYQGGSNYFNEAWYSDDMASYWYGDLGHETLIGRVQATYFFPGGFYMGANLGWDNGNAFTTTQSTTWAATGEGYNEYPNGKADMPRMADFMNLRIQFGFETTSELPVDVPFFDDTIMLGIYFNVFNVFNNQVETSVTTNIDSGNYGLPTAYQAPRSLQLGFRLEL